MTQKSFDRALKKGTIGERIIKQFLEGKGWVVYQPTTDGAHAFDMLSIKNKRQAIAIDVKAKARMNKYPATGVNLKHFKEYADFSKKHLMPFWIIFVDEMQQSIYGNSLEELEKPRTVDNSSYPRNIETGNGTIRIWPLLAMKDICKLTDKQAFELKEHNQRTHQYSVQGWGVS